MRHIFESLAYQSGFPLSQLFSSRRDVSSSSAVPVNLSAMPLPPLFNCRSTPIPSASSMPNVRTSASFTLPPCKDKSHAWMEGESGNEENDIKWPNGLTFVNALTGRSNEAKLLSDSGHSRLQYDHGWGNASNVFLSVDGNAKMEEKFWSSFILPAGTATSSSLDHIADQNPAEYGIGAGIMFSDDTRSFLG